MRKVFFGMFACSLLIAGSGCKKTTAADVVSGNWTVLSNHYNIQGTDPCQYKLEYTELDQAVVTKISDNTVSIAVVNGTTRVVDISSGKLDENANASGIGYYGSSTDTLEWTLSGSTLHGRIKGATCPSFEVIATRN